MHVCVCLVPRIADISLDLPWHVYCWEGQAWLVWPHDNIHLCFKCIENTVGSKVLTFKGWIMWSATQEILSVFLQTFPCLISQLSPNFHSPADQVYVLFLSLNISDCLVSCLSWEKPWVRILWRWGHVESPLWTTDACINHVPQLGPADEIIKRISFALHLV